MLLAAVEEENQLLKKMTGAIVGLKPWSIAKKEEDWEVLTWEKERITTSGIEESC